MKICLVWPWGFEKDRIIPLAFGYLKSNIDPEKYDVKVIDNTYHDRRSDDPEFLREIKEYDPAVVGLSGWTRTAHEALEIADRVREVLPNAVIIMGGIHASAYPDKVAYHPSLDFILQGEAELSFPKFLHQLEAEKKDWGSVPGLIYRNADNDGLTKNAMEFVEDLDQINWPDYDVINLEGYLKNGYRYKTNSKRNAPIWVTRGCPYRCTFCSAPALNGKPVRTHSVDYMKRYISHMYHEKGIRWLSIVDDNFTFHVRYAKEFCDAVVDMGLKDLKFGTPNGVRMQKGDPELWRKMKSAGWEYLVIAPESGSEHTIKIMKKDLKLDTVPGIVDDIRASGLKVHAFFMVGYPGERVEDIVKTGKMMRDLKIDFPIFGLFQPLPGTPIYDELVSKGEIVDGLIPGDAVKGEMAYISPELKNFNLPWFTFKTYLRLVLKNPSVVPYVISLFGVKILADRIMPLMLHSIGIGKLLKKPEWWKASAQNRTHSSSTE